MAVITLGGLTLPGDLFWSDEFQWSPVRRSADYSLTGALIVQESTRLAGRPITLEAQNGPLGYVWLERAVVVNLQTLADTAGWSGPLTLADGRAFSVAFRDEGLTAEPVIHQTHSAALDALPYTFTLKLHTV